MLRWREQGKEQAMEQEREQATAQISYCQDLQRREEENLKASVKEQDKNLAIFLQGKKQRDLLRKKVENRQSKISCGRSWRRRRRRHRRESGKRRTRCSRRQSS